MMFQGRREGVLVLICCLMISGVKVITGGSIRRYHVVRSVDGGVNYGRVEIFENGIWGTVCDDSWDFNDANVVCRQLGFSGATSSHGSAAFGQGSGPILRDHIHCQGSEASLLDCPYDQLGLNHWNHAEDSSAVCSYDTSVVRLVDGGVNYGRVEIYENGQWGTVCHDSWDINDANVVCRQLGFSGATSSPTSAAYGQGSGPILRDHIDCQGSEASLLDCPYHQLGLNHCNHAEDSSAVCSYDTSVVRLVDGGVNYGRVEIYENGQWGTVCHDSWDINDVNVVCRQLGFSGATSSPKSAAYGQGSGPILRDHIHCQGSEASLLDCPYDQLGLNHCNHAEDSSAVCDTSVVRLVDGGVNYGRVEIYENGQWGTVCHDSWDINDANVVCRQLGFSGATSYPKSAAYGQGSGPILRHHVHCQGSEASLLDCPYDQLEQYHCDHSEDSSAVCY